MEQSVASEDAAASGTRRRAATDESSARDPALDPVAVARLLTIIEERWRDSTGILQFKTRDSEAAGLVVLDSGNICWAVSAGMEGRFTELLRRHSPVTPESEFNALYQRCQREGLSLQLVLAGLGICDEAEFHGITEKHCLEAVARLGETPLVPHWKERTGPGYEPSKAFSSLELLLRVGEENYPAEAEEARECLHRVLRGNSAIAGAVLGTPQGPLVASVQTSVKACPMSAVLSWGRWGRRTLRAAQHFEPEVRLATARSSGAEHLLTFSIGNIVYFIVCPDAGYGARVIGQLI